MDQAQKVSVIGLGLMGAAIARRLIKAGHDVTVWNRTHSKAEALAAEGATAVENLADALEASPVSLWCLLDYQMMAELMAEERNSAALRGRTVIPSATGGPDDVQLVADVLEPLDASLLDAKIMFFPAQVGAPDAELLLAGCPVAHEKYQGLLADTAGICRYLGEDVTAASVLYTAVWSYDFASRYAYMEAAAVVEASGLRLEDFEQSAALRTAQFAEQNAELSDRFARGVFDGDQATVDVYAEGMAPMLGVFSRLGLSAVMLEGVGRYSDAAKRTGHGLSDVSIIFDLLRRRSI